MRTHVTIAIVACVVAATLLGGAEAVSRQHREKHRASTLSQSNCACGWASPSTCVTNDGSECFRVCCLQSKECTAKKGSCGPAASCKAGSSVVTKLCPGKGDNVCCVPNGGAPVKPPTTPVTPPAPTNPVPPAPTAGGGVDASLTSNGVTTRYWDCCKPSCAWPSNVPSGKQPVKSCARDGVTKVNANSNNVCSGGGAGGVAYTCNDNAPFVGTDGVAYGFVATQIGRCCDCFMLQFKSTNKKMVVQRTNTGGDLSSNQFDIQMPGGGVGLFNGCSAAQANGPAQWGSSYAWGQTYGGVGSRAACAQLPPALQSGCQFRFDYVGDNPQVRFKQVTCPAALTARSGCQ